METADYWAIVVGDACMNSSGNVVVTGLTGSTSLKLAKLKMTMNDVIRMIEQQPAGSVYSRLLWAMHGKLREQADALEDVAPGDSLRKMDKRLTKRLPYDLITGSGYEKAF